MPSALIIPGVQVKTEFEPSPVLPGATGILGVVGVADRGPVTPTQVGNFAEFIDIFGPASRYTMPEVRGAFANGVSRVVIARTSPGRGGKASLVLKDDDGEDVVKIEARAEGAWANKLSVQATQVRGLSGAGVKFVNLAVKLNGQVVETFNGLVTDEDSPDYLFDRINFSSRTIIAVDPKFEKGLPIDQIATPLADAEARSAKASLKAGGADVILVEAKRNGKGGNQAAVLVEEGQAGLTLTGPANAASLDIKARVPGAAGRSIRLSVTANPDATVNVTVTPAAGAPRVLGPFTTLDDLVNRLKTDPDVTADALGAALPTAIASTPLARRVNVSVIAEGRDTQVYSHLADLAAVAAINDPTVKLTVVPGATALPDVNTGVNLTGGRGKGASLALVGDGGDDPLLELVPASGVKGALAVAVQRGVSTIDNATGVVALTITVDGDIAETFPDLTMDPDDPNFLPEVLVSSSALIRAHDLIVRSRTTSLPKHMSKPANLTGGTSPSTDDYQDALDRLEGEESVDLVIASVANQLTDAEVVTVHQEVTAHCTKMADVARNRIGLGSPSISETNDVNKILDHANSVRSDYFIFTAPAGMEAAVAGLLGRQDYFQSPTFKTIAAPTAPLVRYSDSQLEKLITGNVLAVNEKRNLGIIVIKGLLTSGRQVNVQRTANKAVRDVKAISDKYIGLLNNAGTRNALRQQIFAMFLQMERDGALVPSVDGKDPAFAVDVYSTQADFANGIVRIDIAIRPVRAIDYIYATILVKN
ncbi:MAG TPA: phage tail sheath subtilisin-like domain-containing protein [Tepidisphaeraceae bacterium]|nr:phage tail sheath subtilisin-like domain-containing protein [Tepidisphaeraceae bacterium]